jgi:starch synthase (maltosyl-transferring)
MINRVIIEKISPSLACEDLPVKSAQGERFSVQAVILCDGHEVVRSRLRYRHEKERRWKSLPMIFQGNDIWEASFSPTELGYYLYTVDASLDELHKWKHDTLAKMHAKVLEDVDLQQGVLLFQAWLPRVPKRHREIIQDKISFLQNLTPQVTDQDFEKIFSDGALQKISENLKDPTHATLPKPLRVFVEPPLARFGAWYEFFPRSSAKQIGKHGTFSTAMERLEYIADLGFNVVYLPPIHPIGHQKRKGKNNSLIAGKEDVGSPWAIGTSEGGHKAIHPALGSLKDFERFNNKAEQLGLKLALDIAFQCSPDHPYLKSHPEWFNKRADGTIQYAENPPKKYEDIYPFHFYGPHQKSLWHELKSIFEFWIHKGVSVFRVDNPHTKPFAFWRWLIHDIKSHHPEVIFLSEAFTRPHIMKYLAKIGFSQSYTYFTWRTNKRELQEYITELTDPDLMSYYRPNFWPNTPDILSGPLRHGTRNDFAIRFLLASTLCSNYGIYGPAFELLENTPRDQTSEEYANSEKYELKNWKWDDPASLAPLIRQINEIRRQHPAFHSMKNLRFLETANEFLIAYFNYANDNDELIVTVVNLDPQKTQSGLLRFTTGEHGWNEDETFKVEDILNGNNYIWHGNSHYIELNPTKTCAHIFRCYRKPPVARKPSEDLHE